MIKTKLSISGKESVSLSGEHCAKVADVVEAMRKSFYENRVVIL